MTISPPRFYASLLASFSLLGAVCAVPGLAQQNEISERSSPTASGYPSGAPLGEPAASGAEARIANCGDAVSEALGQTGSGMPCWSDIRTVDHWNTMTLGRSMTVLGSNPVVIPGGGRTGFSYTAGGLGALLYQKGPDAQAFGGQGAVSGFVRGRKLQMTFEDGGAAGDFRLSGEHFAGLNRAALRAAGSVKARWSWQGGITNSYGNDALRTVGPLDYRKIGGTSAGSMEAPVIDVVAYGLHAGNILDEQEDAKVTFQQTRRTSMGVSVAHTFRHYEDDHATAQTERVRAEALRSLTQNSAIGVFAGASRQTGPARCSLAGLGAVGLLQLGRMVSVSASGALDGASPSCGKRVQGTGDLAVYLRASPRTDLFLSGNRDLSGGVVERAIFLNSASAGVRQRFSSGASLRVTGAAIHFNDIGTNAAHTGSFAEADGIFPIGRNLLQEATYRHYQVSRLPIADNRNVVTFTLWWSPNRGEPEEVAARH